MFCSLEINLQAPKSEDFLSNPPDFADPIRLKLPLFTRANAAGVLFAAPQALVHNNTYQRLSPKLADIDVGSMTETPG
jgi:hypothetical protein